VPYLATRLDPGASEKHIACLEDRHTLGHWAGKRITAGELDDYRAKMNVRSLDSLPGLRVARRDAGERLWYGDIRAAVQKRNAIQLILVAALSSILTAVSMYMLDLTRVSSPLRI
jgi:hypothetical protein